MELELRSITEDEHAPWSRHIERAFGHHNKEQDIAAWRSVSELDRTIAAFDGGDIVGTAGAFSFDMALPGGSTLPVAGVTAVSVRSTHRRRGVLRRMMAHQLDDVAARGEPIAVLTASETIIYGRFGYGLASQYWAWSIKNEGITLATPSSTSGRIRLIEKDEAAKVLPGIRERTWRRHPGELGWSQAWWDKYLLDLESERSGASALWFAIHESDAGEADGYATWRTKPAWDGGLPNGEIVVDHLRGLDDDVECRLFEHLLSVDLVRKVTAWGRPVEEPLRWRLADARRLRVTNVLDHLWVRLLDVERAVSSRELGSDERLVIDVADDFRPQTAGTYVIEGGECRRDDTATADLALDVRDLGAMYLGGVSATTLAHAGRVDERTAGALQRADRLFASSHVPWCATEF
jgi:predicted acetyltransferase